jgi:hypothetical protein
MIITSETKISECPISVRLSNTLRSNGYNYVKDLKTLHRSSAYRLRNMGKKTYIELYHFMISMGYDLENEEETILEIHDVCDICRNREFSKKQHDFLVNYIKDRTNFTLE